MADEKKSFVNPIPQQTTKKIQYNCKLYPVPTLHKYNGQFSKAQKP